MRRWLLMLLAAPALWAQATLGSAAVSGTVHDESGAAAPDATVVLTEVSRALERRSGSNDAGRFAFPTLPPGAYSLRVFKEGFDAYQIQQFNLEVGQRAAFDVVLKIGQVSTVLTVSGSEVLLETESNTLGTVIDSARVEELPLNGRNLLQLALTAAGANEAVGRANVADQTGHPGRAVILAGNPGGATGYIVNGIAVRGGRLGELALNLSIADIDQFKVQQSFFMPDQGPNPGLVNVTTKGGGNRFHGELFEFVRNKVFDARNFFSPGPEDLHRNQFGASAGGPLRKDRLWFHANYEGLREITAFSARAYTPTRAMFGGDLREVPEVIHDPLSFSAESGTRQPFPNQTIPAGRINPVSRRLLEYYLPGSSLAQRPQNLFGNPRNTLRDDQFSIRIDAALTGRQNLFSQFIHSNSPSVQPGLFPLAGAFYPNETQLWMAQHTWTMRSSLVSTLRLGMARNVALFSNEGRKRGPILRDIGILNTLDDRGVTSVGFVEYSGFGRANGDLGNLDNNYQLDQGMNYVSGSHNFQFGASIRYRRTWQQNANAGAHGSLGFQRTFTAQLQRDAQGRLAPRPGSGNSFADLLLGMNTTGSFRGLPMLPYRFTQFMPYLQDTWKLTRRLTLNYGVSWFHASVPEPQGFARNLAHGFDETEGLLKFAALGEINPSIVSGERNNFTPRLGLAWQPQFLPHTVIRGGAGVYFSDSRLIELQFGMVGPPFNDSVDAFNSAFVPLPEFLLGRNIFPATPVRPLDRNYAAGLRNAAPFLINEQGRTPYMQQWNLSVQHTIGNNNFLEVAYLGGSNHALQNRYDFNQCRPGPDLRCDMATRPYFRYTSLLRADFNGNSSYHALAARYDRRAAAGLNVRLEYTWAKALTDAWEGSSSTETQITTCRRCDKSDAAFDVRHRGVLSAIYDLPFGRGRRFGAGVSRAADLLLGGWTATTIAVFQTGVPFPVSSPNRTGSAFVAHRPNRICDGADGNLANNLRTNGMRFFNTSCFVTPPTGFFGNSGRLVLHGPGINNWDIGIQKFFPLQAREGMRLQFRAELFNGFNHAQFGAPNASADSPNFGLVAGARQPRLIQLGMKLLF